MTTTPELRAQLRELLAAIECCDCGPDYGLERWGGAEDFRPMRITTHCQIALALCAEGHQGMFPDSQAHLVVAAVNALPGLLDDLDALIGGVQ